MRIKRYIWIVGLVFIMATPKPEWGFYGHRLINKMAVFCLPPEMLVFYKRNIDYISDHAVDPDKRRYATKHEAVRHYIDIDVWGTYPFPKLPRSIISALMSYSHYNLVNESGDTTKLIGHQMPDTFQLLNAADSSVYRVYTFEQFHTFFRTHLFNQYYEDEWIVSSSVLDTTLQIEGTLAVTDHFSQEGILPYHLKSMKRQLTRAFDSLDVDKILRLSAEFGHYLGDAHVPLHTTKNYNGQLTDQVGIHAFWESRIPELFAEAQYSFLVGKAEYIEDTDRYFWDIVLDSHRLLEDVLSIEKELSQTFPSDKQYCYDERLDRTIRVQCPEYAAAFQDRMNGMVETRMQDAIYSIASVWYTCWVDAGQPQLPGSRIDVEAEVIKRNPNVKTRVHE